jgi:hypothetical protein
MINFIKKTISLDGKEFIEIIVSIVVILAFLIGLNYFSNKSSLKITINSNNQYVDKQLLYNYYIDNKLDFPKVIERIIKTNTYRFSNTRRNIPLITLVNNNNSLKNESFYEKEIKVLERENNGDNKETFYKEYKNKNMVRLLEFQSSILPKLKTVLTSKEYFNLLIGVKVSSKFLNNIKIKNDGNTNLKNIEVILPFPISDVYGNRGKTFLEIHSIPIGMYHSLETRQDSIRLKLNQLDIDKRISGLSVLTIEKPIFNNEIKKWPRLFEQSHPVL